MSTTERSMRTRFQHEALLYEGESDFVRRTLPFIEEGLDLGEAVLVVVTSDKVTHLRDALGPAHERVRFAAMQQLGRNPARIIPAWQDFIDEQAAAGIVPRGIGEPVYAARSEPELDECHRHEALLNTAFADAPVGWRLMCPYDTESLPDEVVAQAMSNHPIVHLAHGRESSADYEHAVLPFGGVFAEPNSVWQELRFSDGPLLQLREMVAQRATAEGLSPEATADLLQAVNEVATNSLWHGGGYGIMRMWRDGNELVCEIQDRGHITHALIGRERPSIDRDSGRGVWLANQLCDLVQIRSSAQGTTVRLRMSLT